MITFLRPVRPTALRTRSSCHASMSERSMICSSGKISVSSWMTGPNGPLAPELVRTVGMPSAFAERARPSTLCFMTSGEGSRRPVYQPAC